MPRLIADHDDARIARAWAAFAREDAASRAPAGLEARVLNAARTAIAERRRAEAERQRRRWIAGASTIAAGSLAAAAWCLSVIAPPPVSGAATPVPVPAAAPAGDAVPAGRAAGAPPSAAPMTNVEAGRILATPPHALLASRPLFDAADAGVVGIRGVPGARAYHAPIVEPAPYARAAAPVAPAAAAAPEPLAPVAAAPEAWVTREATPLFDPESAEPVAAPAPLANQKTVATPREAPRPKP
jgi:hypothetical protein